MGGGEGEEGAVKNSVTLCHFKMTSVLSIFNLFFFSSLSVTLHIKINKINKIGKLIFLLIQIILIFYYTVKF